MHYDFSTKSTSSKLDQNSTWIKQNIAFSKTSYAYSEKVLDMLDLKIILDADNRKYITCGPCALQYLDDLAFNQ